MVNPLKLLHAAILPCLFFINAGQAVGAPPETGGNPGATECVVVLHGLARTSRSMNKMAEALIRAGFRVVNLDYPSREKSVEAIAAEDLARAVQRCEQAGAQRIHFVTHSLGGIVVRQALSKKKPANLGRVVMLSPPNKGSFVAEKLKSWRLYDWLYGPAGQELGTGEDSLPNRLGPVDYGVGVITGTRHAFFDAWFAALIPAANDGKVSVAEARVAGMADFLVVPETHPFIMNSDRVIQETVYFLRHGTFRAW